MALSSHLTVSSASVGRAMGAGCLPLTTWEQCAAWDAKSWQVLWQVSGRGGSRAQHVAMSPAGLQYATASPGGPLMIWNNRAAELTRTCGQTLPDVSDIAWSAQGLVAAG